MRLAVVHGKYWRAILSSFSSRHNSLSSDLSLALSLMFCIQCACVCLCTIAPGTHAHWIINNYHLHKLTDARVHSRTLAGTKPKSSINEQNTHICTLTHEGARTHAYAASYHVHQVLVYIAICEAVSVCSQPDCGAFRSEIASQQRNGD